MRELRRRLLDHCSNSRDCPEDVLAEIEQLLITKELIQHLHAARDGDR